MSGGRFWRWGHPPENTPETVWYCYIINQTKEREIPKKKFFDEVMQGVRGNNPQHKRRQSQEIEAVNKDLDRKSKKTIADAKKSEAQRRKRGSNDDGIFDKGMFKS